MDTLKLLFLCFSALVALPRIPFAETSHVAVAAGVNHSRVAYVNPVIHGPAYRPLTRVSVGGHGTIPMWKRLGIQYGAAYSQKGWVEWGGSPSLGRLAGQVRTEIDYVELMVLGRAGVGLEDQGLGFHLLVGPTAAVPVRCGLEDSSGTGRERCVASADIDFGIAGGIGIDLRMDARFDFRMTGLYNHSLEAPSEYKGTSFRNFAVRGGVAYRIH